MTGRAGGWLLSEKEYLRNVPRTHYILSLIAFGGMITTFLPWADTIIGINSRAQAVGLHFLAGWYTFLCYLMVFAVLLLNNFLRIGPGWAMAMPSVLSVASAALPLLFILINLFDVRYGVYLSLTCGLMLFLMVWRRKRIIRQIT